LLFCNITDFVGTGFTCEQSAFTQNNALQRIYYVGKTFTVLADMFYGNNPCDWWPRI